MSKIAFVIIKTWCVWYSDFSKRQIFLEQFRDRSKPYEDFQYDFQNVVSRKLKFKQQGEDLDICSFTRW